MKPVAVAILATLLPSCLLIIGLAFLSVHLSVKLRALRVENEELRVASPAIAEAPTTPKAPPPAPAVKQEPEWLSRETSTLYRLSDASNPKWRQDIYDIFCTLTATTMWQHDTLEVYTHPDAEARIAQILEALGYQGHSPTFVLLLLRDRKTRFKIAEHITMSVLLAKTALQSEPESTLFPFSPEIHRDLWVFFQTLEGIKFSPEFSNILAKIPSQIAREHGRINTENMDKTLDLLYQLFLPLVKLEWFGPGWSYPPQARDGNRMDLLNVVTLRLRMLGSRQQFEFRWDDTTEPYFCRNPAVYSHAGEDGVPLVEPKLWVESEIINAGNVDEGPDINIVSTDGAGA